MSARPEHFAIPELCNTTAIALLILFSQLLVVVLLLSGGEINWLRFGLMSLFVQWVALVSAGLVCALRPVLVKMTLSLGVSLMFAVVLLVTALISLVSEWVVYRGDDLLLRLAGQLTVSGIITGLVLRYFYVQQKLRLQEQAELHSRIQALQSRIRPHFLFNSMNIIAALIATDPKTAEVVVEDLSELFRASLNDAGNQVLMSEELDLCERYIRIEALRLGDRLRMHWHVDTTDDTVQIPMLTVQPLLENAIYHGIQPLPDGGSIELRVHYTDEYVSVCITNPLPGPSHVRQNQGNRMALQNIRSRLNVLYGNRATLDAREEADQFVTHLRFPKTAKLV